MTHLDTLAEYLAEREFHERNLWRLLPPEDRNRFRDTAKGFMDMLVLLEAAPHKSGLEPDAADPVPPTPDAVGLPSMDDIIEAVGRVINRPPESFTQTLDLDRDTIAAQMAAVYLCRLYLEPIPTHEDLRQGVIPNKGRGTVSNMLARFWLNAGAVGAAAQASILLGREKSWRENVTTNMPAWSVCNGH